MITPFALTPPPRRAPPAVLSWVGGKSWLAPRLVSEMMPCLAPGVTYVEPFAGSLAVFLSLRAHGWRGPAILGDKMAGLIGFYRSIADGKWEYIHARAACYDPTPPEGARKKERDRLKNDAYLDVRERYNLETNYSDSTQAARFLWLNHRAFNGILRHNQSGEVNAPWGGPERTFLPDLSDLEQLARDLAGCTILEADFEETLSHAPPGSVIYADPPYLGAFVGYAGAFRETEQGRLARALLAARGRGCYVWASNSLAARPLYGDSWDVEEVRISYRVGGEGERRGSSSEILAYGGPLEA